MHNHTLRSSRRAAFTLIELLTVIAIIGILASILLPAISAAKRSAQKAADLANIRSIGQAALIFANTNNDQLPDPIANAALPTGSAVTGGNYYQIWFGQLAQSGALTNPAILFSKLDPYYPAVMPGIILTPGTVAIDPTFTNAKIIPSYNVVGGISASDPSTEPIAFTRGLTQAGQWSATPTSPYGPEGGMVVFVAGNVAQYKSIGAPSELSATNGYTTKNILQTINYVTTGNQRVYGAGVTGDTIGSTAGTASIAPPTTNQ